MFLTRSENDQIPLSLQEISAADIVNTVLEYYQYVAEERGISLKMTGDAKIKVDPLLFKRVIANLIDNSLVHPHELSEISIAICTETQQVSIKITDNGNGIPQEHLPFLFQGFYSFNQQSHKYHTGLGLTICKAIMTNHGGKMYLTSKEMAGTSVQLILPAPAECI